MAGVTETEERIAREATDILVLLGRPDLEVSSRQVVRWRVEANIFDLEGFQPVGRGNRRYYPANAPTIAAQFRLVLGDVRDLEEAVLVAFARGIPIAEFGLQKAYERWFRSFQPLVARAQRPTKRSERILLPGPRRSGDDIVRYAVTNAVLDKGVHEYEVASVIERLDLDEVLAAVDEGPSYFVEAVSSLAFSVLRKTSCRATRADLEWGRDTSRALFGFVIAVADRFSATGTEGAEPFHLAFGALGRTAKKMFGSRALPSPELGLAVANGFRTWRHARRSFSPPRNCSPPALMRLPAAISCSCGWLIRWSKLQSKSSGAASGFRDDYGKLWFNILDYTGTATRNFADPAFDGDPAFATQEEIDQHGKTKSHGSHYARSAGNEGGEIHEPPGGTVISDPPPPERRKFYYDGGQVEIAAELVHELDADGKQLRVIKLTDYTAEKVRTLCTSPDELRARWANAGQRADIMLTPL